jgi:hypothetical protein
MGQLTIDEHNISLLNTLLAQDAGKCLDFIEELLVGDRLLGVRHRTVVEYGREVAVTSVHVAVDAVVAG